MRVIEIQLGGSMELDRCDDCHGIFFDPGELESILEDANQRVYDVDHQRLATLVEEETPTGDFQQVAYVPCPDCTKLMNRKSYGVRSGVIIDQCRDHGIWLDGGELRRLVQWSRAGGQLHDQRQTIAKRAMEEKLRSTPPTAPEGGFVLPQSRGRALLDDDSEWESSGGLLVDALRVFSSLLR